MLTLSPRLFAEYNSTNLFDGTTTNFGGNYFLPNSSFGTNNYLIIINGGAVTNAIGTVGYLSGDNYNHAIIDGTNSIWKNTSDLRIGISGSGNQMIVTNGGRVESTVGRVAFSGSDNLALITGSNSAWIMSADFQVGDSGKNNQLTIAAGGLVVDTVGYIGSIGASNSIVLVTDPGSVWSNTSTLNAGYAGNYGRLIITNGGLVVNGIGQMGGYNGGSNNVVVVTGNGSTWRNSSSLSLGAAANAGDNRLTIADNATVVNTSANIGSAGSSGNNLVMVTGGSLWSNTSTLAVGGSGNNNQLIITNGGRVFVGNNVITVGSSSTNNQLSLTAGSSMVSAGAALGSSSGADNNSVIVSGTGTTWTNNGTFIVGSSGGSNRITVSNGGVVVTTNGAVTIGNAATSGGNVLTVTGSGSMWTNASSVVVGGSGHGNQLIVSNSATFYSGNVMLGSTTSSSNSLAVVDGVGSTWNYTAATTLTIGYDGYSNQLRVANGGHLIGNSTAYLGGDLGLGHNQATVSGTGSSWDLGAGTLYVGWNSVENQLLVANGGSVRMAGLVLSPSAIASSVSNRVIVTGAGSTLTNTANIIVGSVNAFNQLTVSDGAQLVNSGSVTIGSATASSNNVAVVTGANAVWTNGGRVDIGFSGGGNRLIVSNGASLYGTSVRLGYSSTSSDNLAVVTGANSVWNYMPGTEFSVGYDGSTNRVIVTDGGQLVGNSSAFIGGSTGQGHNSVTVSGSGSRWDTGAGQLNLGWNSADNELIVTNGGSVKVNGLLVSAYASVQPSVSNRVTVTGPGSTLTNNGGSIIVGSANGYNQFTVTDGGQVVNVGTATVGPTTGTNIATVGGPNSVWTNTSNLTIGSSGSGNQLIITNGGKVYGTLGYVGLSGNGNTAVITGSNSLWQASGYIQVGDSGRDNQLTISDGGRVSSVHGYVGSIGAVSNSVLVTGAGSTWDFNNGTFYAGYYGPYGQVVISNGGRAIANQTRIGQAASSTNNLTVITGAGSILQNATYVLVGANGFTSGSGTILVKDGGTLEASYLYGGTGGSGTISNTGGIYQFNTSLPAVTPNTAGAISISNGTISYRGVVGADIYNGQVANMTFQGDNTFQLNNSSNNTGLASYTFDSVANTGTATNYQRLALINTGSLWQSTALTIGTGGALLASNATATVAASLISSGGVFVVNSKMTFVSNVVIHGSYVSDPSTNTFLNDVTIGQSGSLAGGVGDLFDFKKSLFINSTNKSVFDLRVSAVQFGGGGMHTNAITGTDFGTNDAGFFNNFSYGELHLGSATDQVCFTCGILPPPAVTNIGLYVGWLDLLGNASLVTNLHAASGINIYYDKTDARNSYLGGLTYGLTDCSFNPGGGSLVAVIPEPSSLLLLTFAVAVLLTRKRRSR